jgi:hypothetical protein
MHCSQPLASELELGFKHPWMVGTSDCARVVGHKIATRNVDILDIVEESFFYFMPPGSVFRNYFLSEIKKAKKNENLPKLVLKITVLRQSIK